MDGALNWSGESVERKKRNQEMICGEAVVSVLSEDLCRGSKG